MSRPVPVRLLACLLLAPLLLPGAAARAENLTVGTAGAGGDAPLFIAAEQGFFHDEGLDVSFVEFDSAAKMIAPLGAGELDVGGGATSSALYNAAKRQVSIRIVADKARNIRGQGFQALMLRRDLSESGQVRGFADLKGRRIAVSAKGAAEEYILREALSQGGLTLADVDEIYLGFGQQPAAYANKAVDASVTIEPTSTFLLQSGAAVKLASVDQFVPDYQTAVTLYGAEFIARKPEAARHFMRALIRAMRWYNDSLTDGRMQGAKADRLVEIMTKYGTVKNPAIWRAMVATGVDPDGHVNLASLRASWQFFRDTRQIDGSVTVDDVVDLRFLDQALAELGPYHRQ